MLQMHVDPESVFEAEQAVQLVAKGPVHLKQDVLHAKHAGAELLPLS